MQLDDELASQLQLEQLRLREVEHLEVDIIRDLHEAENNVAGA